MKAGFFWKRGERLEYSIDLEKNELSTLIKALESKGIKVPGEFHKALSDFPAWMIPAMETLRKRGPCGDWKAKNGKSAEALIIQPIDFIGAPSRIRTCDLRIRSPSLYPSELWARDPSAWMGVRGGDRVAKREDFSV
jgi:hypothetical protein